MKNDAMMPRMIIDANKLEGACFELPVKLNTLDSMNYEKNKKINFSFWIDK